MRVAAVTEDNAAPPEPELDAHGVFDPIVYISTRGTSQRYYRCSYMVDHMKIEPIEDMIAANRIAVQYPLPWHCKSRIITAVVETYCRERALIRDIDSVVDAPAHAVCPDAAPVVAAEGQVSEIEWQEMQRRVAELEAERNQYRELYNRTELDCKILQERMQASQAVQTDLTTPPSMEVEQSSMGAAVQTTSVQM